MYNKIEAEKTIKVLEYKFQRKLLKIMDKTERLVELVDGRLLRKIKLKEAVKYSLTDLGFDETWWAIYYNFAMIYYAPHHSYKKKTPIEASTPSEEVHEILVEHNKIEKEKEKKQTEHRQDTFSLEKKIIKRAEFTL